MACYHFVWTCIENAGNEPADVPIPRTVCGNAETKNAKSSDIESEISP